LHNPVHGQTDTITITQSTRRR